MSVPQTVYPAVCCSGSGCFPFGANRNNAVGNIRVQVFAWTRGFISLGCRPSRRIAGSYRNWKFHFPQPFQTVSPSDYTILPFPLALFEGSDFPHPTYTHYYLFSILVGTSGISLRFAVQEKCRRHPYTECKKTMLTE